MWNQARKGHEVHDHRYSFDMDANFSWNVNLTSVGTVTDLRSAAAVWGDLLNLAYRWQTNELTELVNLDPALALARSVWANVDQLISTAGIVPPTSDINFFRTAIVAAFQSRIAHMRDELARLPTVLQAVVAQAAQVPKFLDLIAARTGESVIGSMVGGLSSFLVRTEVRPAGCSETELWQLVFRPFFSGILNSANTSRRTEPHSSMQFPFTNLAALQQSITALPQRTISGAPLDCTLRLPMPVQPAFHTVQAATPPPAYINTAAQFQASMTGGAGQGWGGVQAVRNTDVLPSVDMEIGRNDRSRPFNSVAERDRSGNRAGQSRFSNTAPGQMFRPLSPAIVGMKIARLVPPPAIRYTCKHCQNRISHVNGPHRAYECPLGYFQAYHEPCPGFDRDGNTISEDWMAGGTIIKRDVKSKWKEYIERHRIQPDPAEAIMGGGVDFDRDRVGPLQDLSRAAPGQPWRARPGRGP